MEHGGTCHETSFEWNVSEYARIIHEYALRSFKIIKVLQKRPLGDDELMNAQTGSNTRVRSADMHGSKISKHSLI